MPAWLLITQKELRDALRDRRALLPLLLFPLLAPLGIYFMLNSLIDLGEDARDVELPVLGADYAPDLIDYLRQNGISITRLAASEEEAAFSTASSARLEDLIERRVHDFVLLVPADFQTRVAQSRPVNLELHHDSTRTASSAGIARVENLVRAWGQESAALRLLLRGVSPDLIRPVNLSRIDVANRQARARPILGMIPLLVVIAAFISGMGLAVDATAGERERKSLEPLLVNPLRRSTIVVGKWLAAVTFSITGLVLVMSLNFFALAQVPLEQLGIAFAPGVPEIAGVLITTLPLAFLASSMQLFLGIFARSFKDAQAYLSLLMMLPVVPYFFNIYNSSDREFWMNFVPMLGQHMLLTDVIGGRVPPLADFLWAGLTVLLCSGVFVILTALMFKRERIIVS